MSDKLGTNNRPSNMPKTATPLRLSPAAMASIINNFALQPYFISHLKIAYPANTLQTQPANLQKHTIEQTILERQRLVEETRRANAAKFEQEHARYLKQTLKGQKIISNLSVLQGVAQAAKYPLNTNVLQIEKNRSSD